MLRSRLATALRVGLAGNLRRRWVATTRESFLTGTSGVYVEQMYEAWKADPNSVHAVSKWYSVQLYLTHYCSRGMHSS